MEKILKDFKEAHTIGSGPLLATTLSPIAPPNDPDLLRAIYQSSDSANISSSLRTHLLAHTHTALRFSKAEGNAWVDIYTAYWKAAGEISYAEEDPNPKWSKVYEAWKEVANTVIKGYSNGFQAWTLPCLYVAGKHLRVFAIKADEMTSRNPGANQSNGGFGDDFVGEFDRNKTLEDAARVINRMFTLCISDRYVDLNAKLSLQAF